MHRMDIPSVQAALDAIDSIEHGCNLEAAQIERMAASGTAWCPTITMISAFMATSTSPTLAGSPRSPLLRGGPAMSCCCWPRHSA